jgi:hypothetical protein
MLRMCVVGALLVPSLAVASPQRAITRDDIRIDREIGDRNGYVDDLERAVAKASYDVFRTTGMNIRPRLAYLSKRLGGYETADAYGPRVYINRIERPETVAFTVFHEAGHVAYRHDRYRDTQSSELWADEYAGRILAATGGDIRAAIADYRSRGDRLHGPGDMRASALVIGFLRNGGTLPADITQRIRERLADRLDAISAAAHRRAVTLRSAKRTKA